MFDDLTEIEPDVNHLAKAGMDAIELKRIYGNRMGCCGNSNMLIWKSGDRE